MEDAEKKQEAIPTNEFARATYQPIKKSESDVTIFDPRGVDDYLAAYPELRQIPEFSNLLVGELKFVWWYANPTSPLVKTQKNPAKRSNSAFGKVWGFQPSEHRDEAKFTSYCSLNFPEPIRLAIERMSKFDYTARFRAKIMADKTFSDCEEMTNLTIEDFKKTLSDKEGNIVGEDIDYTKFLNVKKMALAMIPELLKIKEEGFGVTDKKKSDSSETAQQNYNDFLDEDI